MKDYLDHLAERAKAPENALKPRLLTIFEPASPSLVPALAAFNIGEASETEPSSAVEGPQLRRTVRPALSSDREGSVGTASSHPGGLMAGDRPQPLHPLREDVAVEPLGAGSHSDLSMSQPLTQRKEEASSFRPRAWPEKEADLDGDPTGQSSQLVPPSEIRLKKELESPVVGTSLRHRPEDSSPPMRGQPAMPVLHSLQPGLRPKLTPPQTREEPRLRSEVPSTIHVTIGRIEVRAAAPLGAAAPTRRMRAAPVLGLKEYLERRKGGAGR